MNTMDTRKEEAQMLLSRYGQEHLLRHYDELDDASRRKLISRIMQLDLQAVEQAWQRWKDSPAQSLAGMELTPMQASSWDEYTEEERERYASAGWNLLEQGKVGAIVVAGGQGSRLGYEGPKGAYDIGLPSGKSLFQLQAERLIHLSEKAGKPIAWYIMTSPENHEQTVHFFEQHYYFGYPREHCTFFVQGAMPAIDEHGKILMSAKDEICLAPSGNGDCFAALKRTGAMLDMKRRGLEWLFYYNVDNALVRVADPLFIGAAASHPFPVAAKSVDKLYPEEPVGIFCYRNGLPSVVEYTVIPEEVMYAKDDQGRLLYRQGHISIQLFRLDFIEKAADLNLPYELAHKKIRHFDTSGALINPSEPNAYKMERFVFDFYPAAGDMTVWKVRREEEFAPVKNREGEDSPDSARLLLLELHRKWLLEAGVTAERLDDRQVEISPLVSYAGEGLTQDVLRSLGI
ncbi:UDPGP type 1 family protein [Paenibacillus sp. 32352]|uniref:UDPGP type 1 family protein n=1 Tax=Paenibacillus sp. 32352 TaxID=1969111 RepID=UPI0021185ED6|nr:UDPGP type 1 family protein [Paenibacillus sp. 32352]